MSDIIEIRTPLSNLVLKNLRLGMRICISGNIYAGRDAALPRLIKLLQTQRMNDINIDLSGSVVFHTAVSPAGIGPTSSNKLEIESSIPELSKAGVKMHIGKGRISQDTVLALREYGSVYAITPPLSALLTMRVKATKMVAFPEEGIEALHLLYVEDFPAIIAAINGRSIYDNV